MSSSRIQHPSLAQAIAQHHHNNPMDTLTNRVADGVSKGLVGSGQNRMLRGTRKLAEPQQWDVLIKAKVKEVLQDVLTADDAAGLSLRMDLIAMLASSGRHASVIEATAVDDKVRQNKAAQVQPAEDPLLSTADAAKMLGFSRTYIAMLIDNGKLPGATVSDGGHRRVPQSAVLDYQAMRDAQSGSTDFRKAGKAAGMYDIPEREYIAAARRPDSGPLRATATKKTTRK